jgi:hypothetical protein
LRCPCLWCLLLLHLKLLLPLLLQLKLPLLLLLQLKLLLLLLSCRFRCVLRRRRPDGVVLP